MSTEVSPAVRLEIVEKTNALKDELASKIKETEQRVKDEQAAGVKEIMSALSEQGALIANLSEKASVASAVNQQLVVNLQNEINRLSSEVADIRAQLASKPNGGKPEKAEEKPETIPPSQHPAVQLRFKELDNRTKIWVAIAGSMTVIVPSVITILMKFFE